MARVILVSGKGGVGKTTVSAATALQAAKQGKRTIVLSFDLAHSLSDSFNLDGDLFNLNRGLPVNVAPNLDIQEIDVQEELERHWQDIYRYISFLFVGGGLDNIIAEEVAIMPGMEDIVSLLYLNQYMSEGYYDVIVIDCPPTSEALRFVSISATLDWYVRKRLKVDRKVAKVLRPMAKAFTNIQYFLPEDSYFEAIKKLFEQLEGVEEMLHDPKVTTVRLVCNPEKMVIRETQRAFMYFCMYGISIDMVVLNRVLPVEEGFFREWATTQETYAGEVEDYFDPVPVFRLPMQSREVNGLERLGEFGDLLFEDRDPAAIYVDSPSYGFKKMEDETYRLEIGLPFAIKEEIEINRQREDLVVRVGTFKRNILLPRAIAPLSTANAKMEDDKLVINFIKEVAS